MAINIYDPLSDLARIKLSLSSMFCDNEDITRLVMPSLDDSDFTWEENWYGGNFKETITGKTKIVTLIGHCFDTPYIEGTVTDNRCAIFIETTLESVPNQFIKEVSVDVSVICHRGSVRISKEDKAYYESKGIYGNRVDCLCQLINSSILSPRIMDGIMRKYSIGKMKLSDGNPIRLYVPGTKFYGKILRYNYYTNYQTKSNIKK